MSNIYKIQSKELKSKKLENFFEKAMEELIAFYNINWIDNQPRLLFVDKRKDFDLITRSKTEPWVVGKALDFNTILFISPESYEKESIHKYSDEYYYFLIKHELSHLFYSILSQNKGPVWLDEGFAIYTSGELEKKVRPQSFKNFLSYYSEEDEYVYEEAGFVVDVLIKKYGQEMVIEFLKKLPEIENQESFSQQFKEHFGIELSYESIKKITKIT